MRRCWIKLLLLSIATGGFACPANAQFKSATAPPPSFSADVSVVQMLVSVRDRSGAPVRDLNIEDFQISDSGAPQTISVFERNTSVPLSVAILIDVSASTMTSLHFEADSVLKFLPALLNAGNPQDEFALFSFNWRTNMESDYSRNLKRAERALRGLKGEGGTSLYDAIFLGSDTLRDRDGRHVMVVVTDGGDTVSYKKFQDALTAAQRADVLLYPLVVVPIASDAGRNTGGEHALATLAVSTGGRIFYPAGFELLTAAFTEILHDLRTQYVLGFQPAGVPDARGIFHPVIVTTRRPGLTVQTRRGYYQP